MSDFNRINYTKLILERLGLNRSAFFYVRGRRRVGKSWILKKISKSLPHTFYYMGAQDLTDSNSISNFIAEWESFSKIVRLSNLKPALLSWKVVFDEITSYVQNNKKNTVLIFDEIQWIAKEGSGFIGKLKEAWLDLEQSKKAKIIICGSSNKFFQQHTGGEETTLRGMRTHSDINIQPLSMQQCKKEYFKNWNNSEMTIAYMMTGGVPYYLNQIDQNNAFIPAINDAFFLKDTIFIDEVDEVLKLEFNKQGIKTVKSILSAIGTFGANQSTIIKKTKISDSTVSEVLIKLDEYNIIETQFPTGAAQKGNRNGAKYLIKDFYLNTYFSLIAPLTAKIRKNKNNLIFSTEYLKKSSSNYIENYTGPMFEKIIRHVLDSRSMKENIFKKLNLRDENFEITQYWDKERQIDLIINHPQDRISRAIEIKWVNDHKTNLKQIFIELEDKYYPLPKNFTRKNYLAISSIKNIDKKTPAILMGDLF
jgi:uncharacterized protein